MPPLPLTNRSSPSNSKPAYAGCTDFQKFDPWVSPWTAVSIAVMIVSLMLVAGVLFLRYARWGKDDWVGSAARDARAYQLPGWPRQASYGRGNPRVLFAWRVACLVLAVSCIVYQWAPIHYFSSHGVFNTTQPPHSSAPGCYRFYTVWNFHLVLIYFSIGTWLSAQGLKLRGADTAVRGGAFAALDEAAVSTGRPDTATVGEDLDDDEIPVSAAATKTPQRHRAGCLEHTHHLIMEVELATTCLIALVVWTVLYEGVAKDQGSAEAFVKFVSFDNLVQHAANVLMVWTDFWLNGQFVTPWHIVVMYGWMVTYSMFHSVIWLMTCFLAYPFMDLRSRFILLWFVGIGTLHGVFYGLGVYCSRNKRRWMASAARASGNLLLARGGGGGMDHGYGTVIFSEGDSTTTSSGGSINNINVARWGNPRQVPGGGDGGQLRSANSSGYLMFS